MATTIAETAPPVPDPPGRAHFVYDGRTAELLGLILRIFALTVVTFGIYRFWGRTRIRKYIWNHTSLLDERLEYDGTGGELFRRFLVAGAVIILIVLPGQIAQLVGLRLWTVAIIQGVAAVIFFYLFFVATYAGRRYRLSRTLWRGMRGGLEGSAPVYGVLGFAYSLLYPLTLGWSLPWQLVGLWRYEMNHTGFGDWQFEFTGTGRKLFRSYLAIFGFVLLGILVGGVIGLVFGVFGYLSSPEELGPVQIIAIAIAYGVVLASLATGILFFYVRLFRYLASGTSFNGITFSVDLRKRDLFRLQVGNMLLVAFTFGLLSPLAAHRIARFFCRHVTIHGAERLEALTQAPGRRERSGGEGLSQLLDAGGFA